MPTAQRRLPPPWSVEEQAAWFVVRDGTPRPAANVIPTVMRIFKRNRARSSSSLLISTRPLKLRENSVAIPEIYQKPLGARQAIAGRVKESGPARGPQS
jgi:hypothetical protein